MQGETLSNDSLPIRVFDRSGTSHRYESGGIHGIERVDEFHRIEIVWIGTPEQVVEESKLLQRCYKHIFDVILDLEWRMAWVTPWFMAQEGMIGLAGDSRVGTIDYEAYMPYRGNRKTSEWLEFQNLSVNGDKYPKGFNIKAQKGELWSGCSGVGLQRWASAFFAQKGFDPENWPKKFHTRVYHHMRIYIVSRNRTRSPCGDTVRLPSHITLWPRTKVPTGQPVTLMPL